jgi:hypothetical protein
MVGNFTIDGNINMSAGHAINHNNTATRDKIRVWNASNYAIGMDNLMSFGGLDDYAMTFQMNNDGNRGWLFLDDAHTDAQGAMSLTTNGKLAVAHSLRLAYGESDTTTPGASYRLDVNGTAQFLGDVTIGDGSSNTNLLIKKSDNNVSDHLQFYNGTTRIGEIGCHDGTWLRINQVTAKNIYTPRYIRADAGFFVDGTSKGINGSGNFIGGTIAGASDYGTLLRSNANNDSATGTFRTSASYIEAGKGSGSVALTINDGYGNANIAFNHLAGVPDTNGSANRIETHVDNGTGFFMFEIGNNVTSGSAVSLTECLYFTTSAITFLGNTMWHAGNDGSGSGLDADKLDGLQGSSYLRTDATTTFNASGNDFNIDYDNSRTLVRIQRSGTEKLRLNASANTLTINTYNSGALRFGTGLFPSANNTYDLGSSSLRWNNLYVNDMHFSNEGSQNSVDGSWGDWTLQEGENDIFMINNRTGKKFKIAMIPV